MINLYIKKYKLNLNLFGSGTLPWNLLNNEQYLQNTW